MNTFFFGLGKTLHVYSSSCLFMSAIASRILVNSSFNLCTVAADKEAQGVAMALLATPLSLEHLVFPAGSYHFSKYRLRQQEMFSC